MDKISDTATTTKVIVIHKIEASDKEKFLKVTSEISSKTSGENLIVIWNCYNKIFVSPSFNKVFILIIEINSSTSHTIVTSTYNVG